MVSVIVPVYNTILYLDECVKSIINQSYKDLEIILVDDGSTDGSEKKIDEYAAFDKRVKALHKSNGGLSVARNCGIEISSGEFLAFVDSDDYIAPDYIECLLKMFEMNPECDLAICGYNWFEDGESVESNGYVFDCDIVEREQILDAISFCLGRDYIFYTVAWNKLYRRSLWETLRYPGGRWHEDEFVIHKLIDNIRKAVVTTDELYFYRKREGSIVNIPAKKDLNCQHFDVVYALKDRIELYNAKYPQYIEKAVHYLLRKCYVLYEEYGNIDNPNVKEKLMEIRGICEESYKLTKSKLGIRERVKMEAFIAMPLVYSKMAMEKERNNND